MRTSCRRIWMLSEMRSLWIWTQRRLISLQETKDFHRSPIPEVLQTTSGTLLRFTMTKTECPLTIQLLEILVLPPIRNLMMIRSMTLARHHQCRTWRKHHQKPSGTQRPLRRQSQQSNAMMFPPWSASSVLTIPNLGELILNFSFCFLITKQLLYLLFLYQNRVLKIWYWLKQLVELLTAK